MAVSRLLLLTVFTPETEFSFELGVRFERVLQLADVISRCTGVIKKPTSAVLRHHLHHQCTMCTK